MYDLDSSNLYDYSYARPLSSNGPWERIVDSDYPMDLDGSRLGPEDCFKLEFSGWKMHIEFKPKHLKVTQ